MKKLHLQFSKQNFQLVARMMILFAAFGFFGTAAIAQIATVTPSSRCGKGPVILHATATSGTIKWYTVPLYGTAIGVCPQTTGGCTSAGGTTLTTDSISVTTAFYVDAVDANGCSLNSDKVRWVVIASVSASTIQASIFYSSTTFCKTESSPQPVTQTGSSGGVYSYTAYGTITPVYTTPSTTPLVIGANGSITPSTSNTGAYTVTYTVAIPPDGCIENPASTDVTITAASTQPTIEYTTLNGPSPYCTSHADLNVTQIGTTGGSYSALPAGLVINASTGKITTSASASGAYTITYFVAGTGGCAPQTATTTLTILQQATASIVYSPDTYTKNQTSATVTISGTGTYTGGSYAAIPGGLSIDAPTGTINPSLSTAGVYTVTYSLNAVSPCAAVSVSTPVTIYALPTATIAASASAVCKLSTPEPTVTFTGSLGLAPYTFIYKVNGGVDQSVSSVTPSSVAIITQSTATAGTFVYTLVSVTDANGSLTTISGQTATIAVNVSKVALFSYVDSPYCNNRSNPSPTFLDGGVAGTFTYTPAVSGNVLSIDGATGVITLSTSTPGTYTVTNTISEANNGGCGEVVATATVTISRWPVAVFSYPYTPYCSVTLPTAVPTVTDYGVFTADDLSVVFFVGGTAGTIDVIQTPPNISPSVNYTITNTILAANGCAERSATTQIHILPQPVLTNERAVSTCSGTSPNIALTSVPSAAGYTWTIGTPTGQTITGASAGSGTVINQTLTNPSNYLYGTVDYIVTPNAVGGCDGLPTTITVTVIPTPQLSSTLTPAAICSGTTFGYTATSAATAPTFAWTRATIAGITEPGTSGTGNVSETLTNTTTSPIVVTYSYITTADGCSNTAQSVVVTLDPWPTAGAGGTATICSNTAVTVTGASATSGTILWTHNGNGTLTNATTLTPTYTSTLADAGNTVTLTMTVTSNNTCLSPVVHTATATYTVIVSPIPATLYVNSTYTSATSGWQCSKFATLETAFAASYASSSANLIILENNLIQSASISIPASDQLEVSAGIGLTVPTGVTITIPQTGGLINKGTLTIQSGGATTSAMVSGGSNVGSGVTIVHAGGTMTDFGSVYVGATGTINPTVGTLEMYAASMTVPSGSSLSILKDFGVTDLLTVNGTATNSAGKLFTVGGILQINAIGRFVNHGSIIVGSTTGVKTLNMAGTFAGENLPTGDGIIYYTGTVEVTTDNELRNAMAAVETPATIKMMNNITSFVQPDGFALIGIWKAIILDGNSKTLLTPYTSSTIPSNTDINAVMQISNQPALIGVVTIKNLTIDANNAINNAFQAHKAANSVVLQNFTVKNARHTGLMVNRSPNVTLSGFTGTTNGYYDIFVKAPDTWNASLIATGVPCTSRIFKANPGATMSVAVSINGTAMSDAVGTELATANGIQEGGTPGHSAPVPTFLVQAGASVCANVDVTYTTQDGATNYLWVVPGVLTTDYTITSGSLGTTSNTVTLKWVSSGSKTVTINYTKYGCTLGPVSSVTTTVNPNATISLTSAVGTNSQTPCINTAITNITYLVGGGGTSAGVSGLPAGVTGTFSGSVFTISGTPTETGSFTYTVITTGTCAQTNATGTITVKPDAVITLSSLAGTDNQSIGLGSAITNITYAISGGGTGAVISAGSLPGGVTGSYSGGVFTISGTPSAIGVYSYTVTTTGTCVQHSLSGTITVHVLPQGSLTANGPFCATGSGTLTFTSTAGTAPFTVVYSDGVSNHTATGVVSGTPFAVFTTPVTSTTTYTLVSVTDIYVTRTTGFTGNTATITVNAIPDAPSGSSSQSFCSGS